MELRKKTLLPALLFSLVLALAVADTSSVPKTAFPAPLKTFSTMETFSGFDLKAPPPTPIVDEPPYVVYSNETLAALIEGNRTVSPPPRNMLLSNFLFANTSIIEGRPVQYEASEANNSNVAPASCEIIDSDVKYGSKLKVSALFYKDVGEQDPNWDYYAVKATIEDIYAKNDFWKGPLYAKIILLFPDWCEELPSNHKPEAGFRLWSGSVSFGFKGIGFNVQLPAYSISYEYSKNKYPGWLYIKWSFDGAWGPFAYWYFVFKDYAEAAVGIRVPQGRKPYCYVAGWAAWYRFRVFVFIRDSSEMVGWCRVDPPDDEFPEPPSPPEETPPSTAPGPVPTKNATAVDGFLYTVAFTDSSYSKVKYESMSGFGQNFYGWHVAEYSWVFFFAAVSDNGNPVANVAVDFYLVNPNYDVYYLGAYYTSEDGIASCAVSFDPSLASGLWWFIPVYQNLQDQCAFSYVYTLLITGYTYMACWNSIIIESALLVPENTVVQLTANPPSGYIFKYWWVNFYYQCYGNPIYVLMDFDCIVLARFDPEGNAGSGGASVCPRPHLN